MNFQSFADSVAMPCCVLSVKKTEDGFCGPIRIVCANRLYKETMGPAYFDNMPYEELVPADNKFEDFCFRAAILKQRMHAYVETRALHCWTDQTMIPLESDRDDIGYCQFIFEFTETLEAERLANVSAETASLVIRSCIRLMGTDNFESRIGDVLNDILEASGADGCRALLFNHEKKEISTLSERIRANVWSNQNSDHEEYDYELASSWEEMLDVTNAVIVKDEADMRMIEKKNPQWAQSLRTYQVKSLVLLPFRRKKTVIGYLYVVNYNVSRTAEVKEMLELISFFLGSEISNYIYYHMLETYSNTDELTGLKNRHYLMNRNIKLEEAGSKEPFGIITMDLNGLKHINDTQGHMAGDLLIINTAEFLTKTFEEDEVFRLGGDEFIVVVNKIGPEAFEEKVRVFRNDILPRSGISIAVGTFYYNGNGRIHDAFECADHNMYANKKAYYREHPELC